MHKKKWGGADQGPNESPTLSSFPFHFRSIICPYKYVDLNTANGLAERGKLSQRGPSRRRSRNRIWWILALKSDIRWQQF